MTVKSRMALATGVAAAALVSLGTVATPAHADVPCTSKTFHIYFSDLHTCVRKTTQDIGMPNRAVKRIKAGKYNGYLVRRGSGQKVYFKKGDDKRLGGAKFSKLHLD